MTLLQSLEKLRQEVMQRVKNNDSAHDFSHIMRVYKNAKRIARKEGANQNLVLTAVLLHDIVSYPKFHPRSKNSSAESAKEAQKILQRYHYGQDEIKIISDAIRDHSFSKWTVPETLEGKVLQDADRLDAIGAIGIARAFYSSKDPFCRARSPDDNMWTVDHFYKKLLLLEKKMNTKTAKIEARGRIKIMKKFLDQLESEI